MADMVRGLDEHFPHRTFGLPELFREDRRRVLGRVVRAALLRHEETYRQIWEQSRSLVHYLREVDVPLPDVLRLTAQHVLEERIGAELAALATHGAIPARAFELADEAEALGLTLDLGFARPLLRDAVHRALSALATDPSPEGIAAALALIEGATRLRVGFGRWAAQNDFFALWRARPDTRPALTPLARALGFAPGEEPAA